MQGFILFLLFLSFLMALTPLYAGSQTLTTYYPAPQGDYVNMEVNQVLTLMPYPSAYTCASLNNEIFIVDISGVLNLCEGGKAYPLSSNNLWEAEPAGAPTYLVPYTSGENVGIGTWAADPGVALGVNGNTILGAAGASPVNTLTVNGTTTFNGLTTVNNGNNLVIGNWGATVGNLLFQGSASTESYILMTNQGDQWTKLISKGGGAWDPTNLESSYGLDLTYAAGGNSEEYGFRINNAISGTSVPVFEELGGNVGIGAPLSPGVVPTAKLEVNGGAGTAVQVNGGAGTAVQVNGQSSQIAVQVNGQNTSLSIGSTTVTSPSINVCTNAGASCGYLAVNQGTDNNYYAVYGP